MSHLDDDAEDETAIGITRYPVMPSLVALQQMKNRLHLAHLGKKLMKWRALATGREMRRLAYELNVSYAQYREDVTRAFMSLARARYFFPNLNKMVVNNPCPKATVTVNVSTRSTAGVKIIQLELIQGMKSPYQHLGIEQGGQAIAEAKQAWLDLLRCMVLIVQERTSFVELEIAHKNATKRENILKKIIIPRIQLTIRYIILELEELAREELNRIKMIKLNNLIAIDEKSQVDKLENMSTDNEKSQNKYSQPQKSNEPSEAIFDYLDVKLKNITRICKHLLDVAVYDKNQCTLCVDEELRYRFEYLKDHLHKVIGIAKEFRNDTSVSPGVEQFINACEEVDDKLNNQIKSLGMDFAKNDAGVHLDKLKNNINDFNKVSENFIYQGFMSKDATKLLPSSEIIVNQIDSCSKQKVNGSKKQQRYFEKCSIIMNNEGMAPTSIERFLSTCNDFRNKLDMSRFNCNDNEPQMNAHLKKVLSRIDQAILVSRQAKEAGLISDSVENFIAACEKIKDIVSNKKQEDLDGMQAISKNSQSEIISKSIEDFLNCCGVAETKINTCGRLPTREEEETETIESLYSGTCTCDNDKDFSEDLCNACQEILDELKSTKKEKQSLYSKMRPRDIVQNDPPKIIRVPIESPISKKHSKKYLSNASSNQASEEEISCSSKTVSHTSLLGSVCSELPSKVQTVNRPVKKYSKASLNSTSFHDTMSNKNGLCCQSNTDQRLGYSETQTKKITTIKRSKNSDGTVTEEKVTTTVKKEKYDPNQLEMSDVDDDLSQDSLLQGDIKNCVHICEISPRAGCFRFSKSECSSTSAPMTDPKLRKCQSKFD